MPIKEIFPNSTVKEVVFQIRFPNLFSIESKIGELQSQIMKEFPESALLFQKKFLIADVGSASKIEDIKDLNTEPGYKIWQFKSKKDFKLNVLSDSLTITSEYHKTYNLEGGDKFRDIIKFVVDNFLKITLIPSIKRIGLRYIDECPITRKNNQTFRSYYNTTFPLRRFNLVDAEKMSFETVVKKDKYNMRYVESLKREGGKYKLILDFDGFAKDVNSGDYLEVTDKLHEIILKEYERSIKAPVYRYMRRKRGRKK